MLNFTKDILRHSAVWNTTEQDCSSVTGFPPGKVLNVNEGYEVLHFVSRYMATRYWSSEITFKNIESTLKTRLPYGVQTHKQVKEWLDINFRR